MILESSNQMGKIEEQSIFLFDFSIYKYAKRCLTYFVTLQFLGALKSNEKPCVCNVFATPRSKNPAKSSLPSSLNVNLERSDNEKSNAFRVIEFQKKFSTPQDFGPWGVFYVFFNKIMVYFV